MNVLGGALEGLWQVREHQDRPYLLINDTRGYFADAPPSISVDGADISVRVCENEWGLRIRTECERGTDAPGRRILVSRQQLEPDHLPDLQLRATMSPRTITGCDVAKALGVTEPRALLDRLPIPAFWRLAPYLPHLDQYSLERLILASLLEDPELLATGWVPNRVLQKLWYEGSLARVRSVLDAVEQKERRKLEREFLDVVRPWLDDAQYAVVQAAVIEHRPPPVLPLCLLAAILNRWETLSPARMRAFLDDTELGDLFGDVLRDGADLSGLAAWGGQVIVRDDRPCSEALDYLQKHVFPRRPSALTEALTTLVSAVDGVGADRLLGQLVRLLEADGGVLAQGLAVTLHTLLGVAIGDLPKDLPLESVPCDLTKELRSANSAQWEALLIALRSHQSQQVIGLAIWTHGNTVHSCLPD